MSDQPKWKLIAQLGDANPIDYGGHFIYQDETGVYTEEAEILQVPEADNDDKEANYVVYRYSIERCTYSNGVLSDNKYHPEHPVWFTYCGEYEKNRGVTGLDRLKSLAEFCGQTVDQFIEALCSSIAAHRTWAWQAVGEYHGFENLDSYPLRFTRAEVEERYKEELEAKL